MSIDALIQAAQNRRTIYKLGKNSPVPDAKIEELVNAAILNVPSSFNTQSTRLVVLLKEEHERLWDIAASTFEGLVASGAVPEETFKNQTLPKLQMFKAAYGTVCPRLARKQVNKILTMLSRSSSTRTPPTSRASRRSSLPLRTTLSPGPTTPTPCTSTSVCSHPSLFSSIPIPILTTKPVWTALESLGFGANLQHYNPLINEPVAKQWNLPTEWRLVAQMVFGSPEAPAGEKTQKPIEERVKIFGKQ